MDLEGSIQRWLERYGAGKATVAVAVTSVLLSVAITVFVEFITGNVSPVGFIIAATVPMMVAPPVAYFTFHMVERVIVSERDLKVALEEIKTLSGMIPICAQCKNVRDDEGYWHQIESYMASHSEAQFSHGLCPGCAEEFMKSIGKTA